MARKARVLLVKGVRLTVCVWLMVGSLVGCVRENTTHPKREAVMIRGVPYISQRERYPTGCESVSAVMALRFMGYDITVERFVEDYLPLGDSPRYVEGLLVGCDPYEKFPGDPRTAGGWGCFAPVIEKAAAGVAGEGVEAVHGMPLEGLCERYIRRGIPVILWATGEMQTPAYHCTWVADTGREVDWYIPMHCLLLVGYDGEYYYFHDPQKGAYTGYGKDMCEIAYEGMGAQALVVASHPQTGKE